jgi:hypothetical protein
LTVGIQNLTLVDERMAGERKHYVNPRKDIYMRVPDEVRKCVVFLGKEIGTERVYGGTGFLVSVSSHTTPLHFMYVVTAKHCADALDGIEFWVRGNSTSGGVLELKAEEGIEWYRHPIDPDHTDVAVFPFLHRPDLDAARIGTRSFFSAATCPNIGIGDDVFITGLFTLAQGSTRNMPIVRMGNIAMMPEDKIPTRKYGDIDAYLIEARSTGGVSGSPVFVRETVNTGRAVPRTTLQGISDKFQLLGLMHGHWDIDPAKINDMAIKGVDIGVNLGIAIVIPADKILEVINHPELVAFRGNMEEAWQERQRTSKTDSNFPVSEEEVFTKGDFEAALKKASRKIAPKS